MKVYSLVVAGTVYLAAEVAAQRADGQYWPCNPTVNASCPPNPGLADSTYTIDFTSLTSQPPNWTVSNDNHINYGPDGAEFTFAKRYDAPQLWTNFFIFFGRVDVVMKAAPGTGIISSSVLISDDFDEIDWEWSGNNFAQWTSKGLVQNNYFGKGVTGSYDRGLFVNVSAPQTTWHTYSVDWKPDRLQWLIDGQVVRTLNAVDCKDKEHQYPQSPSKLQLGLWDGGDPDSNGGTVWWSGGYTDFTKAPYTMYVKKVTINNMFPAYAYNFSDKSGSWQSIKQIQNPDWRGTSSASSSPASSPILKPTGGTASVTSVATAAATGEGSSGSGGAAAVAGAGSGLGTGQGTGQGAGQGSGSTGTGGGSAAGYGSGSSVPGGDSSEQNKAGGSLANGASSGGSIAGSAGLNNANAASNSATKPSSSLAFSSTASYITQSTATPTPVQAGMVPGCVGFYKAQSGDDCATIPKKCGITESDFRAWNPDVGPQCWNLWLNYYQCVAVGSIPASSTIASSVFSTKTTSSSTAGSSTAPGYNSGPGSNAPPLSGSTVASSGSKASTMSTNADTKLNSIPSTGSGGGPTAASAAVTSGTVTSIGTSSAQATTSASESKPANTGGAPGPGSSSFTSSSSITSSSLGFSGTSSSLTLTGSSRLPSSGSTTVSSASTSTLATSASVSSSGGAKPAITTSSVVSSSSTSASSNPANPAPQSTNISKSATSTVSSASSSTSCTSTTAPSLPSQSTKSTTSTQPPASTHSASSQPLCTENRPVPFVGGQFLSYFLHCNVDYPGSDLKPAFSCANLASCVTACNEFKGAQSCDGAAFLPETNVCYLKNFGRGVPKATVQRYKTNCALSGKYAGAAGKWRRDWHLKRHARSGNHRRV